MASPYKLMGYALQIAGMLVLFLGFINLVLSIQKTTGQVTESIRASSGLSPSAPPCDPKKDEMCGVDFNKEGAIEQAFSGRIYEFLFYLGAGIALLFIGLLLRASEEVAGFFAGLSDKDKQKIPVGRVHWEDSLRK